MGDFLIIGGLKHANEQWLAIERALELQQRLRPVSLIASEECERFTDNLMQFIGSEKDQL